uniref:Lectin-1 n=1 Tax=Hypnea musciformis TaxID=31429 RepID=LEC1_HYPMC|nr:RecName: Full=Lectin-1; AltName: Full=HCA; Contains: RecName: Full=Lectin-1 N-terminal subunit; Contains: RecName: Full=Lectin-1 C-terminal subunit [Hypnea musciformis]
QKFCTLDIAPVCCQIVIGGGMYTAGNACMCEGFVSGVGRCENPKECPCTREAQIPSCCSSRWGLVSVTGKCACDCLGGTVAFPEPCPSPY